MHRAHRPCLALAFTALIACNGDPIDSDTDGIDAAGALVISPCGGPDGDFGALSAAEVGSLSVRAANLGQTPITITGISVGSPFSSTGSPPLTVGAASSTQFSVRFQPDGYGAWTSDLDVTWTGDGGTGGTITCAVRGEVRADADGDGFAGADADGTDCDDGDARIYPGATDLWYDGIDSDCDLAPDFDQDRDGYDAAAFNADPETGGDCQDTNAGIHPGAIDAWYDGLDANCDGVDDFDRDGDGWASAAFGGRDCDDFDALQFPDAIEAFNGQDDDCDGEIDIDVDASTSDVQLTGLVTGERFGRSVTSGDWDNDGRGELVVGAWRHEAVTSPVVGEGTARGLVSVWMSDPVSGDRDGASAEFLGPNTTADFGWDVANVGDTDGDGRDDLAIGATGTSSRSGTVWVVSGKDVAFADLGRAIVRVDGNAKQRLGAGIANDVDLDGDGLSELIVAGAHVDLPFITVGIVYGGNPGPRAFYAADAQITEACGPTSGRTCLGPFDPIGGSVPFTENVGAAGDFDGDGRDDLPLADPYNDSVDNQAGRVWVLWGRAAPYAVSSSLTGLATVVASGRTENDGLGIAIGVAPDPDDSGADGLWVSRQSDRAVFLLSGPDLRSGGLDPDTDATAEIRPRSQLATGFGRWSLDSDTAIVAYATTGRGELRTIAVGPLVNTDDDTPFTATVLAGLDETALGVALPPLATDLDGDGQPDLAVGDPEGHGGDGSVRIFRGH